MTYYNFVKETCTGTGSTITLLGAVPGFLSFGDVSFEGDKFAYVIVDADGQRKVTGIAADFFYPDTMMRADTWAFDGTEVVADPSVNITLSGGTHTIYCAESAEQLETILNRIGLAESAVLKRRKNAVINGNFDIWQRGTSQTTSGYGSADRWPVNFLGASTATISRQNHPPGTSQPYWNPTYFLRAVVSAGAGTSDGINLQHRIEGVRTFAGLQVTLSFWAKADASREISCETIQYFGGGGSPSTTVTGLGVSKFNIDSFGWTKCEVTFTIPSIFGKTLGTSSDFLGVNLWLDAGSSFDVRTDSLGHQSGTFDIAQVQLEMGDRASDFEVKTYAEELLDCQRYYWRGMADGQGLANIPKTSGSHLQVFACGGSFPVTMRTLPTTAIVTSPTYNNCTHQAIAVSESGFQHRVDAETSSSAYRAYQGVYEADAEL